MPTTQIRFDIVKSGTGDPTKLPTGRSPHAKRDDKIRWTIANDFGTDITVELLNFDPPDYVNVTTVMPVSIPDGDDTVILANVIKSKPKDSTTITYGVYVNGGYVDPELIIDGDNREPHGGKKGRKTGKTKSAGKTRGAGKKKSAGRKKSAGKKKSGGGKKTGKKR